MAAGAIGAVIAVYLVISAIIGLFAWAAFFIAAALAIAVAVKYTRAAGGTKERRIESKPAKGIVDCAGTSLRIGDDVRASTGFDGPMELAFGRGVVVKLGRGKAHVRFHDIPEQVHPITPGALRRLA
ncbi:hypothetical protein GCM10027176_49130 [Actinoallomurus bryophytorum]|uniref:Uncharacterized protein n=1 Tax=Actinoallomurus bryophytorum TaxID=1490222 RepID=A0A543CFI7_9ACTN|nr:hypothetical protein [Actinoallomurus bryophytorum]TQL95677.1 hypothetical protein FB559_1185 [Actinoallomurus bryophytorum]